MFYPYYFDDTYLLVLAAAIFSMWASARVQSTYNKYYKVRSRRGITAADAALRILNGNGIYDVQIKRTQGKLTDRYVPSERAIYLSDYDSTSIASIGVAAHECGHAIQHHFGYVPLRISQAISPLCAVGSNLGIPILFIGIIFSLTGLINLGIILFGLGFVISLITLPVEYNASNRALSILESFGLLDDEELSGTKKVLRAAGLTYVAAAAASLASLLRLLILTRRNDD